MFNVTSRAQPAGITVITASRERRALPSFCARLGWQQMSHILSMADSVAGDVVHGFAAALLSPAVQSVVKRQGYVKLVSWVLVESEWMVLAWLELGA